ncbi:MAG: hypothetical protein AAGD06_21930 [Acidobacteriota bacterium]
MSHAFFAEEPVVFTYTAMDAVADGVLVSAREGELADVTTQHVKAGLPVYLSHGLYALMARAVENPRAGNDWRGVWHDILSMWRVAVRSRRGVSDFLDFEVDINGAGRTRRHRIFATFDANGLTFMLPEDY